MVKTSPSTNELLEQLDSIEAPARSVSSSLSNEDIVRVAVAIGCISKGITDYGLAGAIQRKRSMAITIVQDTKEMLEIVDQVFRK